MAKRSDADQTTPTPKPKFVRRRAVFGKRGTHARSVTLPELAEFAAAMLAVRPAPGADGGDDGAVERAEAATTTTTTTTKTTTMEPPVEVSEAYAVYCSLLRAGEWERIDMYRGMVRFGRTDNATGECREAVNLLYFVCTKEQHRRRQQQEHDEYNNDGAPSAAAAAAAAAAAHIVVPVSVTECRPTLAMLASLLATSREWRQRLAAQSEREHVRRRTEPGEQRRDDSVNENDEDEDDQNEENYEDDIDDMNDMDEDDIDEEEEEELNDRDDGEGEKQQGGGMASAEPPVGISIAFVDNDGTTTLLRCYDTIEPPEPEANRVQVQ